MIVALVTGVQTCAVPDDFNQIELRRCIVRSRPQQRLPRVLVVMRQRRLERTIIGRSLVLLLRALEGLEFDFGKGCADRSEEHTSELQSLMRISYAVFCLKKKNIP